MIESNGLRGDLDERMLAAGSIVKLEEALRYNFYDSKIQLRSCVTINDDKIQFVVQGDSNMSTTNKSLINDLKKILHSPLRVDYVKKAWVLETESLKELSNGCVVGNMDKINVK